MNNLSPTDIALIILLIFTLMFYVAGPTVLDAIAAWWERRQARRRLYDEDRPDFEAEDVAWEKFYAANREYFEQLGEKAHRQYLAKYGEKDNE